MTKILTYKPPQQYDVLGEILKQVDGNVGALTNWSFRMPRQIEIHLPPYSDPFGSAPKPTKEPCNYKCRVCAGQNSGRELAFGWEPKALKLLDSLKGGVKFIIFSGHYTEPMNSPYFFDFLKKTKETFSHFGVHTNGSRLLDFENQISGITKTLSLPGITADDFISVSVYGGNEKSFSTATGTKLGDNYFRKVVEGISLLGELRQKIKSKISLRISYLGSNINLHPEEAKIIIDLAKKAKFNSLRFSIAFAPYDLDFSVVGAVGDWERQKEKEVLSWLSPSLSKSKKDFPYIFFRPVSIQDIKRFDEIKRCFGGYLQVTISSSGKYVKCATTTTSLGHQLGAVSGDLGSFCTAVAKNQNDKFDPCKDCFEKGLRCDPLCIDFNGRLSRSLTVKEGMDNKDGTIGVALVGKGYWGTILKKYIDADSRFSLLHLAGKSYPLEQIWNDKKVDLVIIATPNEFHSALAIEALKNKKHVLVEKPLALNKKEAEKIVDLSEKMNKFVITDFTQTFSPGLNFLKKNKMNIGKIVSYEIRVGKLELLKNDQTNNVYWHLMPHLLSVLEIFEPISEFNFSPQSLVKNKEGITTTGLLVFKKGFLRASIDYPVKEFKVILYGEYGTAIYSATEDPVVRIIKQGKKGFLKEKVFSFNEKDNLKLMLDYVFKVLNSEEKSNLETAVKVTEILTEVNRISLEKN